jgi:hypothetical protein
MAALINAGDPTAKTGPMGVELHWTAVDDRGVELHLMGRPSQEDPTDLTIIFHCQPTDQRKPR